MKQAYINSLEISFFSSAQDQLDQIIIQLESEDYSDREHGEVEHYINEQGQELLRHLLQGYLDRKASTEIQQPFVNSINEIPLNHVRNQTKRTITSLFGETTVRRKGYSQRHQVSRFLLDAELNLPNDQYSDGIRNRVAREAIRGSFDEAIEVIGDTTGGHVPKRQSLKLVQDVAQDFEHYYQQNRFSEPEDTQDLLVLTFDGKGIVMRPGNLRECTEKAAKKSKRLNSRLSPGERKTENAWLRSRPFIRHILISVPQNLS
jgi:hypothetical protein